MLTCGSFKALDFSNCLQSFSMQTLMIRVRPCAALHSGVCALTSCLSILLLVVSCLAAIYITVKLRESSAEAFDLSAALDLNCQELYECNSSTWHRQQCLVFA